MNPVLSSAELSAIPIIDSVLEGRVWHCPWHGWEFDIVTGKALYDVDSQVTSYPCAMDENGDVVVSL